MFFQIITHKEMSNISAVDVFLIPVSRHGFLLGVQTWVRRYVVSGSLEPRAEKIMELVKYTTHWTVSYALK